MDDGKEIVRLLVDNVPYGPGLWRSLRESPYSFLQRWNTILQITEFNCDNDWLLFLEMALPALGEMVLALIGFDWDDIARAYLRPGGARSRGRGRKKYREEEEFDEDGKKRKKRKAKGGKGRRLQFPELGELIGSKLPGASVIKARKVGGAQRFLWVVDGLAQRALFYWMIADVTTDFYYNWFSGVMKSERCTYGTNGGFRGKADLLADYAPHDWRPVVPSPENIHEWGNSPWKGDHAEFPTDSGTFVFAASWRPLFTVEEISPQFGIMYDWPGGRVVERTTYLKELTTMDEEFVLVDRPPAGAKVYPVVRVQGSGTWAIEDLIVAGGW